MMVHVLADVIQIVVLATGADALLRVGCPNPTCHLTARIDRTEEDRFELIHAGVREQQCRIVQRNHRRRVHVQVLLLREKIEENLPDLRGSQRGVHRRCSHHDR
uniref:Putative secreted protein n=1 Tax=Anopheles darlingi TaxID=43151 RepID=A0A2M4DCU6_ANODA